ncbi:HK97 family phage prohead protease [Kitasatospora sp. RB6PN24]|uniref:HK97 family phage prohead protease n=1 Tax=Kitasatospora humi TaxID=2893891 RepID=UPI001E4BC062|nr:HK97 family phage prohead protease [Kitasatospora humi]MCC9309282.1 HK97 family phage prohead protease [Kitasatospora humi]
MTRSGTASVALEHKQAAALGLLESNDETGTFTSLVSVTGLLDHDGDVIEPGAYARTLAELTPKGVWSHDWNVWTAKTEHIEELLPGDSRLPAALPNGQPWPAGAGALLVKGRCNLATQAGQDMYANLQFFADQVQWSIGYRVRTAKRSKGARHITDLDLYEYSPVLFGANPYTSTVALKQLPQGKARGLLGEVEISLGPLAGTLEERLAAIADAVQEQLQAESGPMAGDCSVQIIGTYPDRAIAYVWQFTEDSYGASAWQVPYTLDNDGNPTTGSPAPVRLLLDVEQADLLEQPPLVPGLEQITSQLKTLAAVEGKEGRALSGANAERIATAVRHLVSVLEAAGINWQQTPPSPQKSTDATSTLHASEISAAMALFADARTPAG